MPRITFVEADGRETVVEAVEGLSIMKAAANAGVPGIAADCGGNCACATCRIYVPRDWRDRLEPPRPTEAEMVEFSGDDTEGVRLSCQVPVTGDLDGLALRLPKSQH